MEIHLYKLFACTQREAPPHVDMDTLNKETFCGESLMTPSSIFREKTIPGAPLRSLARPHIIKPLAGIITITHTTLCCIAPHLCVLCVC